MERLAGALIHRTFPWSWLKIPSVRSEYSFRTFFVVFVAIILILALIALGWVAKLSANAQRLQIEQAAAEKAREIAAAIDREIVGKQNLLIALASSPYLRADSLERFYYQAAEVARTIDVRVVLRGTDSGAAQIFSTAFPFGTALPTTHLARQTEFWRRLTSGRPAVSSVFFGDHQKRHLVTISVPIIRDGDFRYSLSLSTPTENFAAILSRAHLSPHELVTIVDQDHTIVARSEKHSEFTGKMLQYFMERAKTSSSEVSGINLEKVFHSSGFHIHQMQLVGT